MARAHENRWATLALTTGLAVLLGASLVSSAAAQGPSRRFRVLLPKFELEGDVDDDFGDDVIDELRERIDGLPTHAPVDEDEFEDALDRFELDEDELTCPQARQIAIQVRRDDANRSPLAELVMCGTYSPAQQESMRVAVRFVNAQSGESFEVPAFTAAQPERAALHIFSSFERFVNQIRMATFCWQDISSSSFGTALEKCNEALDLNPNSVRALAGKARALFGLADEALAAAQAGADPATPGAAAEATIPAEARDYFRRSLEAYRQVLELDPLHEDALKTAGIAAARIDDKELARSYFTQYLELNPGDIQVRISNAVDLSNAGDPEGALRIAEAGLAEGGEADLTLLTYAGHFALGSAQALMQERQGANGEETLDPATIAMYEKALGYYRRVFEQQGDSADVIMLRNMIATLSHLERYEQAADLAAEIVAAKPGNASLWSTYADVLNRAGRMDLALTALDSVRSLDPEYAGVWRRRGMWLVRADRLDEARPALDSAIARGEMTSDQIARQIFAYGYGEKYQNDLHDEAFEIFSVVRDYAETPETEGMANFFSGYILLLRGRTVQRPSTVESARQALPIFQQALEFFRNSAAFAETQPSVNLQEMIGNAQQFIEIQELLIERG